MKGKKTLTYKPFESMARDLMGWVWQRILTRGLSTLGDHILTDPIV